MDEVLAKKLDGVLARYLELETELASPQVSSDRIKSRKLGQEYRSMRRLIELIKDHKLRCKELRDTCSIIEASGEDAEVVSLAKEERRVLETKIGDLERNIRFELIPKDPADSADGVVEIRAGTGGEEAALFAADLKRMYLRYAERKHWSTSIMHEVYTGVGGIKEVIMEVSGRDAFSRLRLESGVHRVQRVPATESSGRLHTSAATVVVIPKAEELDIKINDEDLKVDVFHAGGHGGQNVNKVATAIRLKHIPSGLVVTCQNERSQLQNRLQAMTVLRARLWDMERQKQVESESAARRSQVGGGDRSEKIRTYNFPQSRITDHRVPFTTHRLMETLAGELDQLIDAVIAHNQALKLGELAS